MSVQADFSMGDNWYQFGKHQRGLSTIVTRSEAADRIVQDMLRAGKLEAESITPEDLVADQGLVNKLNIGIRVHVWRMLGFQNAIYKSAVAGRQVRLPADIAFCPVCVDWQQADSVSVDVVVDLLDWCCGSKLVRPLLASLKRWIGRAIKLMAVPLPTFKPLPRKTAANKIVMIGGYGYQDIGDEAMPHAEFDQAPRAAWRVRRILCLQWTRFLPPSRLDAVQSIR